MSEKLSSMRAQVYKDPRPAEYFERFHKRARSMKRGFVYDLGRLSISPLVWTVFRGRSIGAQNVPATGSLILAPNHSSFMDHFFLGAFIRRRTRFMAKSQLFKPPLQGAFSLGGAFPIRRGYRDEEALTTADLILRRGGCLTMYCEGGRSRTGRIADRAKRGIGRLALESGAWVVPVAIHGSARVRNWKRLEFPRIRVSYGKPIRWEATVQSTLAQQQQAADEILTEIKKLYNELDR